MKSIVRSGDEQFARLFVEQQCLDTPTFAELVAVTVGKSHMVPRVARRTTQRLREAGFIEADRRLSGPLIHYATRQGARFLGLDVPWPVPLSQLAHPSGAVSRCVCSMGVPETVGRRRCCCAWTGGATICPMVWSCRRCPAASRSLKWS